MKGSESGETPRGWRVYIIEIMPKWYELVAPGLPLGRCCYYVGETGKTIDERFYEHRTGRVFAGRKTKRAASVFATMRSRNENQSLRRKVDVRLRRTLSDLLPAVESKESAERLEAETIDLLRQHGHAVYPRGAGAHPFGSYRL